MKYYCGERTPDGCEVMVLDREEPGGGRVLGPRHDLEQHSPTFDWGQPGPGHAQLALALLADVLGDEERARRLYQGFRFRVVNRLAEDRWELSEEDIRQMAATHEAEKARAR